jgi:hypothetical protein
VASNDKHNLRLSVSRFSDRGRCLLSATWAIKEIEGLVVYKCRPAELYQRRADSEIDYSFTPPAAWKVYSRDTLPQPDTRMPKPNALATRMANKLKFKRFPSRAASLQAIAMELFKEQTSKSHLLELDK